MLLLSIYFFPYIFIIDNFVLYWRWWTTRWRRASWVTPTSLGKCSSPIRRCRQVNNLICGLSAKCENWKWLVCPLFLKKKNHWIRSIVSIDFFCSSFLRTWPTSWLIALCRLPAECKIRELKFLLSSHGKSGTTEKHIRFVISINYLLIILLSCCRKWWRETLRSGRCLTIQRSCARWWMSLVILPAYRLIVISSLTSISSNYFCPLVCHFTPTGILSVRNKQVCYLSCHKI